MYAQIDDRRNVRAIVQVLLLVLLVSGCVRVRAYERGHLASPAMAPQFGDEELRLQYEAKMLEARTGGGVPGTAPGGGCGCTQ